LFSSFFAVRRAKDVEWRAAMKIWGSLLASVYHSNTASVQRKLRKIRQMYKQRQNRTIVLQFAAAVCYNKNN